MGSGSPENGGLGGLGGLGQVLLGGITPMPAPATSLTAADIRRAYDLLQQNGGLNNGGHRQAGAQIQGNPLVQPGAFDPGALALNAAQLQAINQAHAADEAARIAEPEDTGVEVGEIIAWRAWDVHEGFLQSVHVNCEWEPGKTIEAHEVGVVLGDGIHAFKTREQVSETYGYGSGSVVGRVKLWGRIYEFEKGYHAEFAAVHSLDFLVEWGELEENSDYLYKLRERYGVAENAYPPVPVYKRLKPSPRWWKLFGFYFSCYVLGYWVPFGIQKAVQWSTEPALALTGVAQWPGL